MRLPLYVDSPGGQHIAEIIVDNQHQELESRGVLRSNIASVVHNLSGQVTMNPCSVHDTHYSSIHIGQWQGNEVAVKVLREVKNKQTTVRKTNREAFVWHHLSHTSILPLYGYCNDLGKYGALISPWYKNGDAGQYIYGVQGDQLHDTQKVRPPARVGPSRRFQLWLEVVEGVAYLHSLQPALVHGDLKLTNVLVDDEERGKICDFGLARMLPCGHKTGLTTSTSYIGTIRYMAYEIAASDEPIVVPTTKSDVYALACLALDLIFLRPPHATCHNAGPLWRALHQQKPPVQTFPVVGTPAEIIKELWELLQQCWSVEPGDRPSAHEMKEWASTHKDALVNAFETNFELALLGQQ
ncbi:kinase-like protein [Serendipita vermifera]|nr:kinase-like protein [Serendipita vermifera]